MRIIAITSPKVIEDDVFLIQRVVETGIDTIHLRTESVEFWWCNNDWKHLSSKCFMQT